MRPSPAPPRPPDVVYVDELQAALRAGPQRFIQKIMLRPAFRKGKFDGFQLVGLDPGLALSQVRPGDVVRRVNGLPVERPDQFMAAWKALAGAERIVFAVVRAGQPMEIVYRVVNRPPPPPVTPPAPPGAPPLPQPPATGSRP